MLLTLSNIDINKHEKVYNITICSNVYSNKEKLTEIFNLLYPNYNFEENCDVIFKRDKKLFNMFCNKLSTTISGLFNQIEQSGRFEIVMFNIYNYLIIKNISPKYISINKFNEKKYLNIVILNQVYFILFQKNNIIISTLHNYL